MELYLVFCDVSLESYGTDVRLLGVFDSAELADKCAENNARFIEKHCSEPALFWIESVKLNDAYNLSIDSRMAECFIYNGMYIDGGLAVGHYYE